METRHVRILVIDDSVTYRKIVTDALGGIPGIEVVGTAPNGKLGLAKIEQLSPDLVTLDQEMPDMDGLTVLKELQQKRGTPPVIMLSAFTDVGATITIQALRLGAFDFVLKPSGGDLTSNVTALRQQLSAKLDVLAKRTILAPSRPAAPPPGMRGLPPPPPAAGNADVVRRLARVASGSGQKPQLVVIGISTGGPQALGQMMPRLPQNLGVPVLIVQHMPPTFTKSLARSLDDSCQLTVREAVDGEPVVANTALIAPGGRQMKIERKPQGLVIKLTDDPPENSCRPSVDYLFRSVAHEVGGAALGVIMTGMGNDGQVGCQLMKRRGAAIMAQDAASCVVYGMPRAIVDNNLADVIAPLDRIADEITRAVREAVPACA